VSHHRRTWCCLVTTNLYINMYCCALNETRPLMWFNGHSFVQVRLEFNSQICILKFLFVFVLRYLFQQSSILIFAFLNFYFFICFTIYLFQQSSILRFVFLNFHFLFVRYIFQLKIKLTQILPLFLKYYRRLVHF
jgi:hypothetical protein